MIAIQLFALALAASPVADEPREAPAAPPAPVSEQTAAKQPTRYCAKYTLTGSRIERKTCRTRDQWLATGFDPLAGK